MHFNLFIINKIFENVASKNVNKFTLLNTIVALLAKRINGKKMLFKHLESA